MEQSEQHQRLRPLINPSSVAVIGVSRNPQKFGRITIDNLRNSPVARELFAVGSSDLDLGDTQVLTSAGELPPVDVAIVASPASQVLETIEAAAQAGTSCFIVYASDFGEGSTKGHHRDKKLRRLIREHDLTVVGPNTIGVVSFAHRFAGTFVPCRDIAQARGDVAVVSQSGGLGWILSHARHEGVGISHMLGAGNSLGLDAADLAMGLLDDPHTHAIALALEGLEDGDAIARLGEASLRAGKPVVAWKSAKSALGAQRAMSHTGTLSGDAKLYSAAFAEAGIIEVSEFEDLVETAAFAAACRDKSAATFSPVVASSSGGAVVMAADSAVDAGVELAPPSARAAETLAGVLPGFTTATNPLDITSFIQSDESALESIITGLTDGGRWPLIFPWSTSHTAANTERIRSLGAISDTLGLPTAVVLLSRWTAAPDRMDVWASQSAVPFGSMRRTFDAIAGIGAWVRAREAGAHEGSDRPALPVGRPAEVTPGSDIRDQWGIPRPCSLIVRDRGSAVAAISEMRPPAVLKFPNDVEHKWSKGGVFTDICDDATMVDAFDLLIERFRAETGEHESRLVLEKQVSRGPEIFLSMLRDATFGPVLLIGPGGTAVDRDPESIVAIMPQVPDAERRERIVEIALSTLPSAARASYRASAESFAEHMVRCYGEFVRDSSLQMVEFNPSILLPTGAFNVVDAVVDTADPSADLA